jgi:hypothetical protein
MQERPDKGAVWRSGARIAGAIVLAFAAAAGISNLCESLALMEWCWGALLLSVLLLLLALPVALLCTLLRTSSRRCIWTRLAWIALALAFLFVTRLPWTLGFDERDTLRMLIRRFDPLVHAIEGFERERGRPPRALEELVPGFLEELPEAQVLGERVQPVLRGADGWSLRTDLALGRWLGYPTGELDYRPDQRYDDAPRAPDFRPRLEDGRYRGWHWRIVWW